MSLKHVVVIGSSIEGQSAALNLREEAPRTRITLISEEEYPLYDRRKLTGFLAGRIREEELFLCTKEYYRQRQIDFLAGRVPAGINPVKKTVSFRRGAGFSYDLLVIASGLRVETPDIPGARKPGAGPLWGLSDAKALTNRIFSDPLCLVAGDNAGLKIARALAERFRQEVKLIVPETLTSTDMPEEVEVLNTRIEEIIGEGQVQAVRITGGKVIGVSAVLFTEPRPSLDYLKGTPVTLDKGKVVVDENGRSSVPEIFACGISAVRQGETAGNKSWDDCASEGRRLASSLGATISEMEQICRKQS
ncbi:MAG: NAD(P)/FAD-dependent oxidoreductase [Candidatus Omnitrophica bacterium]|nr:NAD(P)/FAD-dependent oxidoreductase [Candidatus Omnitrophota bacterium]